MGIETIGLSIVVATVVLDVWRQIVRLVFGVPITNGAMIGRGS